MGRTLLIVLAAAFASACAAAAPQVDLAEAERRAEALVGEPMTCEVRAQTGTRLEELVCKPTVEVERERALAQHYARERNSRDAAGP